MNYFLFFFNVRNLPIYSTVLGVSNQCLVFGCGLIQFISAFLIFALLKNLSSIFPLVSSLFILIFCLAYKQSKFGFTCYFFQMISTFLMWVFWIKKVIIGLDFTVHYMRVGLFKKALLEILLDYLLTGFLVIFSVLILFVVFSYSNELEFEEIKSREEKREMDSEEDTEADSLYSGSYKFGNRNRLVMGNKH